MAKMMPPTFAEIFKEWAEEAGQKVLDLVPEVQSIAFIVNWSPTVQHNIHGVARERDQDGKSVNAHSPLAVYGLLGQMAKSAVSLSKVMGDILLSADEGMKTLARKIDERKKELAEIEQRIADASRRAEEEESKIVDIGYPSPGPYGTAHHPFPGRP